MSSKYVDPAAVIQVIGNVYNNASLLDAEDKYWISEQDFSNEFHRIVFGAMYKLYELGAKEFSLEAINDFLSTRPKSEAIYKDNKGDEWLLKASENASSNSFDYYYKRLKKFTLLRTYDNCGIDISDIYDIDNILDVKKKQLQEEILDNLSLDQIANKVDEKIEAIRTQCVIGDDEEAYQAGEGVLDLIERFKKYPEAGIPMYGPLINTVTRGARLGKFYLRSGATGTGKTRTMIADACYFACERIYDEQFGWIRTGPGQPTLFISTEQELEEIQTMMLAFIANVNEDHIIYNEYEDGEEERVREAAEMLVNAPLYVETMPDFSLQDVENTIKKNLRDRGVRYVCHDYIHSSLKILEEITRRSGGVKLREDNVLFMLSTKLKGIATKYGVFIISATQLSGDYAAAETPDQNLLRGGIYALIYLILIYYQGFESNILKLTGKPKLEIIW